MKATDVLRRLVVRAIATSLLMLVTIHGPIAHSKRTPISKERVEIQTEYGPVILQNVAVEQSGDGVVVTGTVTNNTSRTWRFIAFSLTFKDKSGRKLTSNFAEDGDDSLMREVQVANLGKGETKPLTSTTNESPAELVLRFNGKIADFDIQWVREHSYYDSHPVFALVEPSQNKSLSHEDEAISIRFAVENTQLQFTLSNKTQEALAINWDEVSFVDLKGTAHRVLHEGIKLADRDKSQTPTIIPPRANINDLIEPSDSVEFSTVVGEWEHSPLLPPSQEIANYKGKTFGVFMPLTINGKKKNYNFTIRIADVEK